ncbi:hypothetical protein BAZ12_16210 [Elizabethkingia miricola]|uniref:Uncharacterized protein n=1 Tax=Elizabethkingia miricola TaxID=172045 RepID=A0AAQ1SYP8_ELIMR|nr:MULTISPECIES: hypothetical protein [Elizabethkingia]KUY14380.1 hypothetical protein ATB95_18390 [Elizabethkingia miricola]MCL1654331.1 hypothetical protein [Elizabethkingia miricola]MCL1680996.1 hypothetical protein [Elizabethkingia miricola]MDX8569627.1 hypothetical protein [Elizabethkingia sp. HX XZB]OPC08669.1 hypothetical protein BAY01_14680 [Elizabethkingia miricola]
MNKQILLVLITLFCLSCKKENQIKNISIKEGMSSTTDMFHGKYVVNMMNTSPVTVNFKFSNSERNTIRQVYLKNRLDKESDSIFLEDINNELMPKIPTKYTIEFDDNSRQVIVIYNASDLDSIKGKPNVINFIKRIRLILDSKKEIKNAPISNVEYI